MPVRAGCGRSAEISAGGAGNLYLLPDRLSEARSAGSGDADIGSLKRDDFSSNRHLALAYCWSMIFPKTGAHFSDHALAATAAGPRRLDHALDPVRHFLHALPAVEHRPVDAVTPGQRPVGRLAVERHHLAGIIM